MTRTEILALTGRDLDAAVHQHVFGLPVSRDRYGNYWTDEVGWLGLNAVPAYSTDGNAMLAVLRRVKSRLFFARQRFHDALQELVDSRLRLPPDRSITWPAPLTLFAEVLPEMVARAALLAEASDGR